MFSLSRLLTFAGLAVTLAECAIVPPALQGVPATIDSPPDFNGSTTDTSSIVSTALQVNQKGGATGDAPPDEPASSTTVTAVDGDLVNATVPTVTASRRDVAADAHLSRRNNSNYDLVFWGTGTGPNDRDAAIEGTAYLTYTVVSNATYDIDDCSLSATALKDVVIFVNLYYELWNPLLDFVFSQQSNLKCAAYGDVHNATEKVMLYVNDASERLTRRKRQTLEQSTGWAAKSLVDPPTPPGYELVFGPTDGANNAPGYMGFAFIDQYDVAACAALCDTRGADPVGGACQYFNIWRALVDGVPTTYSCAMYYIVADASTAVNFGQGDLQVTESRGYSRKNVVVDGGFEGYTCGGLDVPLCFTQGYANWQGTSPVGGNFDASIFNYQPYAHTGNSVGLLGSAFGSDQLSGTIAPASPLATVAGQSYTLQFFHSSFYSGAQAEASASMSIIWNGVTIDTIHPGFSQWTGHQYTVTAQGNDLLQFTGGSAPAYVFIDDIALFPM
ncbi:hypothetical protein BDP27DRAFT_1431856 [Rhodocollybia butyracea]|uniref:CBM-cenC domain-containing protein n=1 Tax=Rhodocollybia butyracea TaxID=206335 RepID=A0A9P5P977_9AGAR|nr:hypothetical protein BDP27DRAFT_1431856 [Rhodocollybia butyracea]